MTYFFKTGENFMPTSEESVTVFDKLPPETFAVGFNPMSGYYLRSISAFSRVPKIYGQDFSRNLDRILTTFENRPSGTGVLLSGEQGSGKTLLSKYLSIVGTERGYPTIVCNEPHRGEDFNKFIQSIQQPAIILFDEFEKVYDEEQQQEILTLLDGTYPSKKLFVLTCNQIWNIDSHMLNRPGRLYYLIEYKGLTEDFIREYCADALKDQTMTRDVVRFASLFRPFNFDILCSLVEEMNRYNETVEQAAAILNARPPSVEYTLDIDVYIKGHKITPPFLNTTLVSRNPLTHTMRIEFVTNLPGHVNPSHDWWKDFVAKYNVEKPIKGSRAIDFDDEDDDIKPVDTNSAKDESVRVRQRLSLFSLMFTPHELSRFDENQFVWERPEEEIIVIGTRRVEASEFHFTSLF